MSSSIPFHRQIVPALDSPAELQFALHGWIGDRVRANEANWLIPAPATNPGMVEMFVHRTDATPIVGLTDNTVPWVGEYAGKYLLSAVQSLRLTGSVELADVVHTFVSKLLATQGKDGSLGMPLPWDLWGQYHVMLGLLRWFEYSADEGALLACRRAADLACARYLGRASAIAAEHPKDYEKNQAVVHVLALLYEHTGEARYLDLVHQIENEWSQLSGARFVEDALAGKEFFASARPRWESLHDIQAIAELYFITGDQRYCVAFEYIWRSIRTYDRHVTGGFTCNESASGNPFDPRHIETCGTVAWMALTIDMLRLTADPVAADELELSLFNALLGSQSPDGRLWTYHTPMGGIPTDNISPASYLGYRFPAYYDLAWQARDRYPQLSCCAANGPRGLGCLSEWAVMLANDAIVLNYYGSMMFTLTISGNSGVTLNVETAYPLDGAIQITFASSSAALFAMRLRIPAWSSSNSVTLNGMRQNGVESGTYFEIRRTWQPGDVVTLQLDLGIRVVVGQRNAAGRSAAYRGPLLLAHDTRFSPFDSLSMPAPRLTAPPSIATNVPGAVLLASFPSSAGDVTLCDFASAGGSDAGALFGRPDPAGTWQFSRFDGTVIAERIQLLPDGTIAGYSHPNETRWGYDGDVLTFYELNSLPSTRFTLRLSQYGKQVLSGMSLLDEHVRHVLQQVDPNIIGKTWQFWRRNPDRSATILKSTVRLLAGGGFDEPMHPNEARWSMDGDTLVFYTANGVASTRFTLIQMRNGRVERSGQFLFDGSLTHCLTEVDPDLGSRVWRFIRKRAGEEDHSDTVRLLPNGRLDGYWHPNETSWHWETANDSLTFLDASGIVSTRFGTLNATGGAMSFEGHPVSDNSITHILEEAGPGWPINAEYVSWLPSI